MIAQALSPASDDLVCSLALLDLSDNALFHDADPGQSGRFGAAVAGCGALTTLRLAATQEDSQVLVLGGEPLQQPIKAYGPFVG